MTGNRHLQSWLALHLVPGMGPVTCRKLAEHFGSPARVLAARPAELQTVCRLRRESLAALAAEGGKQLLALADKEMTRAAADNIVVLAWDDPRYPSLLKHIHDPPVILYVQGDPAVLNGRGIGIVGSRAATHYGRSIAGQMAKGLAGHGFAVISGMALGIDTAAHRGALAAAGKTIAVLGCGLDIIYPPSNRGLYQEIAAAGAVVSEYPLGTGPDGFRFPARNRIISGLSHGIVVVEAAARSGSLITASHALEQGREVFAVPGRIDSVHSAGTHALLQQGAKLVHGIHDIVEEFVVAEERRSPDGSGGEDSAREDGGQQLSREETVLFACLDVYPKTIDELVHQSGFSARKTSELLLLLELKGFVASLPGKSYQKNVRMTG